MWRNCKLQRKQFVKEWRMQEFFGENYTGMSYLISLNPMRLYIFKYIYIAYINKYIYIAHVGSFKHFRIRRRLTHLFNTFQCVFWPFGVIFNCFLNGSTDTFAINWLTSWISPQSLLWYSLRAQLVLFEHVNPLLDIGEPGSRDPMEPH